MVISSEEINAEILIPENVKAEILDNVIIVEGRLGKLKKNIMRIPVVARSRQKSLLYDHMGGERKTLQ